MISKTEQTGTHQAPGGSIGPDRGASRSIPNQMKSAPPSSSRLFELVLCEIRMCKLRNGGHVKCARGLAALGLKSCKDLDLLD